MKLNATWIVVIVSIVIVGGFSYAYMLSSDAAMQGLHNKYDMVIEAKVTIPPASSSPMKTGYNSLAWTANLLSVDFGSPTPGKISTLVPIKITNIILSDVTRLHVRTDLTTPGVHLYMGETKDLFEATKIDMSRAEMAKGISYQLPVSTGLSKNPAFGVLIDPGTAAGEITFRIIVSYSYCND